MKTSLVAAVALVTGVALASPVWHAHAQSQADRPLMPQPAPATQILKGVSQGTPTGGTGMGRAGLMAGMAEHGAMGPMHGRAGLRERMMQRMRMSPQQRCEHRLARGAARIAYIGTMLKLTTEQRPSWDKLTAVLQTARDNQLQLCGSIGGGGPQQAQSTAKDRLERAEKFLSARLDALHQARPLLDQLYQSLSPEQRARLDSGTWRR
jgi:hypothetical protein